MAEFFIDIDKLKGGESRLQALVNELKDQLAELA